MNLEDMPKILPQIFNFFEWELTIPLNLKIHFTLKMGGCIASQLGAETLF